MRRFAFPLERLLRLRRQREREWELKLGAATGECVRVQQEIEATIHAVAVNAARGYAGLSLGDMHQRELYRNRMEARAQDLAVVLQRKEAERDQIKSGFINAQRERKVVDKLRERQEGDHYRQERRKEDDVASDMAVMRFSNEAAQGGGTDGGT